VLKKFPNEIYSFARESMHLQITRDALGDEDPPDEVLARELALDKELVQLIQTACKNDKLPRALELTRMLHHTSSFDMAVKVAAFYRLVGLQEKMQALKEDCAASGRSRPRDWARDYDPVLPPHLPPADVPRSGSRAFQDFGPPSAVHRPGLTRATPGLPPLPKDDVYSGNEDYTSAVAGPSESKRKRADDDSITYGNSTLADNAKRRAVEDEEVAMMLRPKPSPRVRIYNFPLLLKQSLTGANPFAKKSSDAADGSRNPFARNNPNNKSLHKSESFFDKAEAAETGKWKGTSCLVIMHFINIEWGMYSHGKCSEWTGSQKG
jgi:chromosome transmission fidelity protein 4